MNSSLFYGFRGSILFPDQTTIFSIGLQNNSSSKNKVFRDYFQMIENNKKLESQYQSRLYYLIFKNKYDDVLHCQLARRKHFNKRDLKDNNIIELEDNDYPYVNIFIELNSQKFLIESNTQVFENYNTCSKVIENIINNNLREKDIRIELNPISEEQNFWNYFHEKSKVYNIEFKLVAPNMFDAEDDATKLLKEAETNVGSSKVTLIFSNEEGNLNPNKKGIDSFIKYISDGGGTWKIKTINSNGENVYISSEQKSTKINISITYEELKNAILTFEQQKIIRDCFNKIETIEKFKEQK